jgi:hypothetical protein
MEEVIATDSQVEAVPQDGSLIGQQENSTWNLADGIPGVGEKPEFFNDKKYGSIIEQAKAQRDLEKRFGGFTGAPESYELSLDEGIETSIDHESEEFKAFEQLARESNMNNDTFNALVNTYLKSVDSLQTQEISEEALESYRKEQLELLGDNASSIIDEVSAWGRNNLSDEDFEAFRGLADTADNIKILQKMIRKGSATKIQSVEKSQPQYSRDDLRKMIGDPRYLNPVSRQDKEYRAQVDALYQKYLQNK